MPDFAFPCGKFMPENLAKLCQKAHFHSSQSNARCHPFGRPISVLARAQLEIAPSLGSCVAALSLRFYVGRSVASHPPKPVQALRSLRSLQPGVLFSQGCGLLVGFLSLVCLVCLVCGAVVPWCCAAVLWRRWCASGCGAAVLRCRGAAVLLRYCGLVLWLWL